MGVAMGVSEPDGGGSLSVALPPLPSLLPSRCYTSSSSSQRQEQQQLEPPSIGVQTAETSSAFSLPSSFSTHWQ